MGDVLINLDFLKDGGKDCEKADPREDEDKVRYSLRGTKNALTFFRYLSTSQGTCERLLKPPNAVPFQTRPVTS